MNNNNNRPVWGANTPDPVATARRRAAVIAANNLPAPRQTNPIPERRPRWNSRILTEGQTFTIPRTIEAVTEANRRGRPGHDVTAIERVAKPPKWNPSTNVRGSHRADTIPMEETERKRDAMAVANTQSRIFVQNQAMLPPTRPDDQADTKRVWRVDRINSMHKDRKDPQIVRIREAVDDANFFSSACQSKTSLEKYINKYILRI